MGSYTLTLAPDSRPNSLFSVSEPKEIRGYMKFMHDKNLRMEKFMERVKKRVFKDEGKGTRLEKREVGAWGANLTPEQ